MEGKTPTKKNRERGWERGERELLTFDLSTPHHHPNAHSTRERVPCHSFLSMSTFTPCETGQRTSVTSWLHTDLWRCTLSAYRPVELYTISLQTCGAVHYQPTDLWSCTPSATDLWSCTLSAYRPVEMYTISQQTCGGVHHQPTELSNT